MHYTSQRVGLSGVIIDLDKEGIVLCVHVVMNYQMTNMLSLLTEQGILIALFINCPY